MYIRRNIEETIKIISDSFKVVLLTGARQVGKTTLLKTLARGTSRIYVTLDDLKVRNLALSEPALFLRKYTPPVIIDEIQHAPALLNYIKIYVDNIDVNGSIWLVGTQRLPLMQGITESLAGRVGIVDMQGLTAEEINNVAMSKQFLPTTEQLYNRLNVAKKQSPEDIYKLIWQGSMPAMHNDRGTIWQNYYGSYVQSFILRDIMKLLQVNDEMAYFRFLCAAAGQTGKIVNYVDLARAAGISAPTAKQWVLALEAAGIIHLLPGFAPSGSKYLIRAPKIHFFDTGLVSYLMNYNNPKALETGAYSSQIFETWAVMEIYKSYTNKGFIPPLYYLRNFNGKELELIIYENGTVYPMAIKNKNYPNKAIKTFNILKPVSTNAKINTGNGGIICLSDALLSVTEQLYYIPVWLI